MDPSLRGNLPNLLLICVFEKLPIISLARFRSVCKQMNRLPLDSAFAPIHAAQAPPLSLLITHISHFSTPGHDAIRRVDQYGQHFVFQWDFLPLSSIFRRLQLIPRASAGGFLCFFLGEDCSSTPNVYYICNPVTREWRTLRPPHGLLDPAIVGMHFDEHKNSCKLIVGADGPSGKSFVYDSARSSWKEIQPLPGNFVAKSTIWPVSVGGLLSWLVEEPSVWGSGQRWVIRFDMAKELWAEPMVAVSKDFPPVICLAESDGQLLMVTVEVRKAAFQVWRLLRGGGGGEWIWEDIRLVDAPPGYFYQPFTGMASDGLLWLAEDGHQTILKYDIRRKLLLQCMFSQDLRCCRIRKTMSSHCLCFQPSFMRFGDPIDFGGEKRRGKS